MKKVKTIVRNLDQLSTYITDQSALSSNIFNITEIPLEFTIGKNLIKLKGNTNLFELGTELAIEILDSNRNPIYHEIIDYRYQKKLRTLFTTNNSIQELEKFLGIPAVSRLMDLTYSNYLVIKGKDIRTSIIPK